MEFVFDPVESAAARGTDLVRAKAQRIGLDRIEIPARTSDEPRRVVIGRIGDVHWSAVITRREDRIWIISVRRSRREEVSWYKGEGS